VRRDNRGRFTIQTQRNMKKEKTIDLSDYVTEFVEHRKIVVIRRIDQYGAPSGLVTLEYPLRITAKVSRITKPMALGVSAKIAWMRGREELLICGVSRKSKTVCLKERL
jgi:hypothetical protein